MWLVELFPAQLHSAISLSFDLSTLTHLDSAVLCAWTVTSDTLLVVTILQVLL